MFASIRRYNGVTQPAEAAKRVREGFLPQLRAMDGFVAYYWVDAGGGVMVSTSVFQSQAAAEESNRRAAAWVKANLAGVLPHPPEISAGQVVADALAQGAFPAQGERREAEGKEFRH